MSSSCMGKELPKEKQFGVKVCRERKCEDLQRDPEHPDSPEFCQVIHGMPGAMPCCIKEADEKHFIRRISAQLNFSPYPSPHPGVRNCPKTCPYRVEKGLICGFTGELLKNWGVCPCNVLGNPEQENHIKNLAATIRVFQSMQPEEILRTCHMRLCPDGVGRCTERKGTDCPVIRMPFKELKECPLWRIPAKMLAAPVAQDPVVPEKPAPIKESSGQKEKIPSRKSSQKEKPEPVARKKKEPADPICEACRVRIPGGPPDYACTSCKEEQEKKGRRLWVSRLGLGSVHLGDMEVLGEQVPDDSVDLIFTGGSYTLTHVPLAPSTVRKRPNSPAQQAQQRIDAAIQKLEARKEYYFSQSCRHDGHPLKEGGSERKENPQLLNAYCERMNGIKEAIALLREGER